MQHASAANSTTCSIASNTPFYPTINKPGLLQPGVLFSQQQNWSLSTIVKWRTTLNVGFLELTSTPNHVTRTSRPAYSLSVSYGILTTVLHSSSTLCDTGAAVILLRADTTSREWKDLMVRKNIFFYCTATKHPLPLDRSIFLQPRLDDVKASMWFEVVQHLGVNVLLGKSFIDHFEQGIFPFERKIAPSHSHLVTIQACRRSTAATTTNVSSCALADDTTRETL